MDKYNTAIAQKISKKLVELEIDVRQVSNEIRDWNLISIDDIHEVTINGIIVIQISFTYSSVPNLIDEIRFSKIYSYFSEYKLVKCVMLKKEITIDHIQEVMTSNDLYGFSRAMSAIFISNLLHDTKLSTDVELWMRLNGLK